MTHPHLQRPKLRSPIDIRFEKVQDQEVLLLSCPVGIAREPLLLIPAVAPILACFEGKMDLDEISHKFKDFGIQRELIQKLAELLDQHLYLAGPQFNAAELQVTQDFLLAPVRPAALAGLGYAAREIDLKNELEKYLSYQKVFSTGADKSLVGIMAPHIDYHRGQECYGITYNALKDYTHNLFLIVGTSHQYSSLLFHLTKKDFATPLGVLLCDKVFVDQLAERYGRERSFKDEILHRKEHSLELQAPFIRYLQPTPDHAAQIVPVLVGSFRRMLTSGKFPEQFENYDSFVTALGDGIIAKQKTGSRICFLAGVDMAHIGKYFGDSFDLTPSIMEKIAERDQAYLKTILTQDKHALFSHIAEDEDARRICGYSSMYTLIDFFDRLGIHYHAELYDYRQAVNPANGCAVTIAGVGFYL